jgi:hypothetical protein
MWFESLTGFREESPEQVRGNLELKGKEIISRINGREMICGQLNTPSLAELRLALQQGPPKSEHLTVKETIADIKDLHKDPENAGALFQVASQFNLLEMASPDYSPELGVDIYEHDRTQGPACAIAAGAGTIYRNYFANVNGQIGQSDDNQIDCLAGVGELFNNTDEKLWTMKNGYAMPTAEGLLNICQQINCMDKLGRDELRRRLHIGIQSDTEVTIADGGHLVSQAYCSALPIAYCPYPDALWEPFARIVLEAAYEATLAASELNRRKSGSNKVYLTLLGGGAFGNRLNWILDAIERALETFSNFPLEVMIVSRSSSNPRVRILCNTAM